MKPKLNLRLKLWKGLGSPVIDETIKKDTLLVYVINFFGILAGRCGSLVVRERDQLLRPWVAIFFLFNRNVFSE